jgi:hypothetical protein
VAERRALPPVKESAMSGGSFPELRLSLYASTEHGQGPAVETQRSISVGARASPAALLARADEVIE